MTTNRIPLPTTYRAGTFRDDNGHRITVATHGHITVDGVFRSDISDDVRRDIYTASLDRAKAVA